MYLLELYGGRIAVAVIDLLPSEYFIDGFGA